jgi:hypothetical protein
MKIKKIGKKIMGKEKIEKRNFYWFNQGNSMVPFLSGQYFEFGIPTNLDRAF